MFSGNWLICNSKLIPSKANSNIWLIGKIIKSDGIFINRRILPAVFSGRSMEAKRGIQVSRQITSYEFRNIGSALIWTGVYSRLFGHLFY